MAKEVGWKIGSAGGTGEEGRLLAKRPFSVSKFIPPASLHTGVVSPAPRGQNETLSTHLLSSRVRSRSPEKDISTLAGLRPFCSRLCPALSSGLYPALEKTAEEMLAE
jgi:hypothetical protein